MRMTFVSLLVLLLAFVWVPGLPLPETVATHFDGSGQANGFMSRNGYHWFMTSLVIFVPLMTVWLPIWLLSRSDAALSLPGKAHWMSVERRAESMAFLNRWFLRTGILILALMGYLHWLTVRANQQTPAMLASDHFLTVLLTFLLAMTGLIVQLFWRFRVGNRASH